MEHKFLNIIGVLAVAAALSCAFYVSKGKDMGAGIKLENMDLSVRPGDDFYDYATRGWAI